MLSSRFDLRGAGVRAVAHGFEKFMPRDSWVAFDVVDKIRDVKIAEIRKTFPVRGG